MNSITVMVNPRIAEKWLEKNLENRDLKPTTLKNLVNEMKSGNWIEETGESIKFLGDFDQLIDGQHRLAAIVESGLSFEFLVNINCSDKAFAVIDTGSVRTAKDMVSMKVNKYAQTIATGVSRFLLFKARQKHFISTARPKNAIIIEEVNRLSAKYDLEELASICASLRTRSVDVIVPSQLFGAALLFCEAGLGYWDIKKAIEETTKRNHFIEYLQTRKLKGQKLLSPEVADITFALIKDALNGRTRNRVTSATYRNAQLEISKNLLF